MSKKHNFVKKQQSIITQGHAEKEVSYNVMELTVEFNKKSEDRSDVAGTVQQDCNIFLQKLAENNFEIKNFLLVRDEVEERQENIKNLPPWLQHKEKFDDDDEENRKVTFFEAIKRLELRTSINMQALNLMKMLLSENKLCGSVKLDYSYEESRAIREKLVKAAVNDSRRKADVLAKAIGLKVVGFAQIVNCDYRRKSRYDDITEMCCCAPSVCKEAEPSDKLSADTRNLYEDIEIEWYVK